MFHLALLTLNVVSSADTDTDCCVQKKVGDILYNFEEIGDGKEHGCFDNCIYSRQGDPDTRFCFKKGYLTATCQEKNDGCDVAGEHYHFLQRKCITLIFQLQ